LKKKKIADDKDDTITATIKKLPFRIKRKLDKNNDRRKLKEKILKQEWVGQNPMATLEGCYLVGGRHHHFCPILRSTGNSQK
jgi:hypothetical protein